MEHQIDETGEFTEEDYNNLLKSGTMTTEEMNRVIALYMGWTENPEYETFSQAAPFEDEVWRLDELPFDNSWSHLMPVWQKLRGDIKHRISPSTVWGDLNTLIERAILDTDITTAHRLMAEAIELIKKK